MSRNKRRLFSGILVVAALAAGIFAWRARFAPTRVALVNFQDFAVAGIAEAAAGIRVDLERFEMGELLGRRLTAHDVIFLSTHGLRLSDEERRHIAAAAERGVVIHTVGAVDPAAEITTLTGASLERVNRYFEYGGRKNERSLLAYARRVLDGKSFRAGEWLEPVPSLSDGFFHLGADDFFADLAAYDAFYQPRFKPGAPRVAIFAQWFMSPRNHHTRRAYDLMIRRLEEKGVNVYPVFGGRRSLEWLKEIRPDLVILSPHGRFAPGRPEEFLAAMRELNIPMLAPLHVNELYEDWMKDQRGMAGGMLSQSIVMPELDGGIAPYVISTLVRNEEGLKVVAPIEERVRRFCERVVRTLALQRKPNAEKRLAVFYYKYGGRNAMTASNLEVAPSLLNLLRRLQAEGYHTGELPATPEALFARIQREGPVMGTFAEGAFEEFVRSGRPALVPAGTLKGWLERNLEPAMLRDLRRDHGDPPGRRMLVAGETEPAVAVARVRFGNVVLLPVPVAGEGDDGFALVHDARQSPAYSYIAAYLWAREKFQADVISHFGTHGSLEFLRWKQAALSSEDWPDVLIGALPHVYLYVVSNPGEALVAKRRSYATLVSHLTAPFMRAALTAEMRKFSELHDALHSYFDDDMPTALRERYRARISRDVIRLNLHRAIGLETPVAGGFNDTELERLSDHVHELNQATVGRGLYVLGRSYTEAEIRETVRIIAAERIADALTRLDYLNGRITRREYEAPQGARKRHLAAGERIVDRLLDRSARPERFIAAADLARLAAWDRQVSVREEAERREGMAAMMGRRRAAETGPQERPRDTQGVMPRDKIATALDPAYMRDLLAGFRPGARPTFENRSRDELAALVGRLRFYLDHAYVAGLLAGRGRDAEAIAAILGSDEARVRLGTQIEAAEAAIRKIDLREEEYAGAVRILRDALWGVERKHQALKVSTRSELDAMINALRSGFIPPSTGGDPVFNPNVLPTGRNLVGIDPERTPSREAHKLGVELAEKVIAERLARTGAYPRKIALTFWGGEFLRDQGIQLAQVFHFLGVEPVYSAFGQVKDVRLIPAERLGRPRIDVVVQTSGQFRDIAASRIYLINKAVRLASAADDPPEFRNAVREGTLAAEELMKAEGIAPVAAREFASIRVFGGVQGIYGTNIMGLVERGDRWDTDAVLARTYLNNMGAMYDEHHWGEFKPSAFRAAIQGTEMILHPRSSNVTGPLSLDHVYEFMGGFSAAIRHVTGRDPAAYFNDMRNPNRLRAQAAKEAIWVEARTTTLNPRWIREQQEEGPSAAEGIAEATRNMYGWDVLKPAEIDEELWQEHFDVYVRDKHGLDMHRYFREKNPYALQEITAVMLETIRKGRWNPDEATRRAIAELHVDLVNERRAGCSGFVCDNALLRDFIAGLVPSAAAAAYRGEIAAVRTSRAGDAVQRTGQVLRREEHSLAAALDFVKRNPVSVGILAALILVVGGAVIYGATWGGRRE